LPKAYILGTVKEVVETSEVMKYTSWHNTLNNMGDINKHTVS
jgi:hypothetical protein